MHFENAYFSIKSMKNKRNEEGLIAKTDTGNRPHAPVVRPGEEPAPEGT